ncbi:shikimate dehydrogenase [Gulosibacter sp. 10]|uniref:shikimate dehydrogenase family protein n=1 Tax=Gulosibacter sp. 10 TaxID=1255570 RepID=UPI00097F5EE9|nr:hypothetical protein [Gulosibacter sp. 10]SJM53926.1 Shikimate 5-dehydrogenase I alpha [Gulosibacter sp. 10]
MAAPHREEPRFPAVPEGLHSVEPPRGGGAARLAVLGDPIEHSRSPQLQLAAYRLLGADWTYERWRIPAGGLEEALRGRGQGWRGFSVTAPLKAEALRFAASASEDAVRSRAANTLVFDALDPGSPARAWNTDIPGAIDAFAERGVAAVEGRADVLGSGGTAASLGIAAERLGAGEVRIWARRPERAAALAESLNASAGGARSRTTFTAADLAAWRLEADAAAVIDTIPGGCAADAEQLRAGLRAGAAPVLFSAAYSPWPTPLAVEWSRAAAPIVTGLDLLLHQAVRQVRLFSGRDIDEALPGELGIIDAMRTALG